jgi:hypothetical protein
MRLFVLLLGLRILAPSLHAQPVFTEVSSNEGIAHLNTSGSPGSGVSFIDFNGDGLDDLTLATDDGEPLQFYLNNGGINFQQLSPLVDDQSEVKQLLWVDYDNDGDKDLFLAVLRAPNRLYRNDGELTFTEVTAAAGLPVDDHRSFGACFGDFDRDGWLDLYYNERKIENGLPANRNRLFRNNADGTFTDVTLSSGAEDPGHIPFCSAFFDYNQDRWPDLYTANDRTSINTLLRNNGDGTFTDTGEEAHANLVMDAMNVAVGDYDNDGDQDLYISNIETGAALLHNLGPAGDDGAYVFEEIAGPAGVGFYGIGWGANFLDADNDGDLDLYASGSLDGSDEISSAYFQNEGDGTFSQPSAGFTGDTVISYTNAIGDYDNNGYPDIFVANQTPYPSQLWRNSLGENNWLKVRLQGVLSNRDAVGSLIEIYQDGRYQQRYTHCGIAFLGQNSATEIFGLGAATSVDSIVITWPTGHQDRLYDQEANQVLDVIEGSTTAGNIQVDEDVMLTIVATRTPEENTILPPGLFPNPARDLLTVQQTRLHWTHYALFSPEGQWLRSGRLLQSAEQLTVAGLAAGTYWLMAWNETGARTTVSWQKL